MSDAYWEVKFPSDKMQVAGEWTKKQAIDAIKAALNEYIEKNVERVEPEPEVPEGLEVSFGDLETDE